MSQRMWWILGAFLNIATLSGCVERQFIIDSVPRGAVVYQNGRYLGVTPVVGSFVYYGTYQFTLYMDHYETLNVKQEVASPWYEYAPLDFVAENIWPFKEQDVRRFTYTLEPIKIPNMNDIIRKAQQLQNHGKSINPPGAPPTTPSEHPELGPPTPLPSNPGSVPPVPGSGMPPALPPPAGTPGTGVTLLPPVSSRPSTPAGSGNN